MENSNINPKISVLVAAYNVEKFIRKCVQSIIEQTYTNLEIIVVDDCSQDDTGRICDELASKDSRIISIHHEKNQRLPGVRNTGLENATGEYIVFVDGDDWLAIDFVEYLYGIIKKTKSDMAISCTNFTTRDMQQTKREYIEIWTPEQATANFLYSRIPIGAWNKIYKREFIEENKLRFKNLFTAEGFRFISDCSQRANQIAVGHRRVYYYRLNNPDSATTLPDIRQGLGALEALNGIERDLIIKSQSVITSIHHHRWANHLYTLRIIIENKSQREHAELYRECLKYISKNGFKVARESRTFKYAIRVIAISIFPIVTSKYEIWKKNIEFRNDTFFD